MSRYRINRKPTAQDSDDQRACDWLDTGLDVEAISEDEAISEALRQKESRETCANIPGDREQLMAALYVL